VTPGSAREDDLLAHVPEGRVPSSLAGERVLDLIRVMARLRGPGGCPWDAEQTHRTLAKHLLEETHELIEAIDTEDDDAIRQELGDLLLQVVFHAQMAADDDRWDIDDVAEGLVKKLIHRHPHVFGEVEVAGSDEVLVNWEKLKATESADAEGTRATAATQPARVDSDIPASLPSLARAAKVQRRAAGWGFGWRTFDGAMAALHEEIGELADAQADHADPNADPNADPDAIEAELGDVLFAAVAVAGKLGVDAESALRRTVRGFADRYERFVALAAERGIDVEAADEDELRSLFREARTTTGSA
jgi:tetrapyrrole methylase family protein/MazG family protein